jgi:hypothetical protein
MGSNKKLKKKKNVEIDSYSQNILLSLRPNKIVFVTIHYLKYARLMLNQLGITSHKAEINNSNLPPPLVRICQEKKKKIGLIRKMQIIIFAELLKFMEHKITNYNELCETCHLLFSTWHVLGRYMYLMA